MLKLQILGTGCPKCNQLANNAVEAAKALGLEYQLEKVTDLKTIAQMGVMFTPALAVNGQVKTSGKVAGVEEIKTLLT